VTTAAFSGSCSVRRVSSIKATASTTSAVPVIRADHVRSDAMSIVVRVLGEQPWKWFHIAAMAATKGLVASRAEGAAVGHGRLSPGPFAYANCCAAQQFARLRAQSTGGCGRLPRPILSSRTLEGIHRFPYEIAPRPRPRVLALACRSFVKPLLAKKELVRGLLAVQQRGWARGGLSSDISVARRSGTASRSVETRRPRTAGRMALASATQVSERAVASARGVEEGLCDAWARVRAQEQLRRWCRRGAPSHEPTALYPPTSSASSSQPAHRACRTSAHSRPRWSRCPSWRRSATSCRGSRSGRSRCP
jgi:hypothetical protein